MQSPSDVQFECYRLSTEYHPRMEGVIQWQLALAYHIPQIRPFGSLSRVRHTTSEDSEKSQSAEAAHEHMPVHSRDTHFRRYHSTGRMKAQ